jgi:hypothetical protein
MGTNPMNAQECLTAIDEVLVSIRGIATRMMAEECFKLSRVRTFVASLIDEVERLRADRIPIAMRDELMKLANQNALAAVDLAAERDAARRYESENLNRVGELTADNDALRRRVEELEKDAARLDWLSSNPRMTEIHMGDKVESGHAYVVTGHSMWTLRQILDACMREPT